MALSAVSSSLSSSGRIQFSPVSGWSKAMQKAGVSPMLAGGHGKSDVALLSYSHLHFYCDGLRPVPEYKALERKLNRLGGVPSSNLQEAGRRWQELLRDDLADDLHDVDGSGSGLEIISSLQNRSQNYSCAGQDLVEQLMVGMGWRVVAAHEGSSTRSVVVSSVNTSGVQFVFTAPHQNSEKQDDAEKFLHFDRSRLENFLACHGGRQGAAVLGFQAGPGDVERIHQRYAEMHPRLLPSNPIKDYEGIRMLEVHAYYLPGKHGETADTGTTLRFVEPCAENHHVGASPEGLSGGFMLPGLEQVSAEFEADSQPAFSDHWVSNVFSRQGFLDTLHETLGFTPKVDFNAGVVAAGEAQIESTVTGNNPDIAIDAAMALMDQHQIYLPINNHITDVGHVHLFLQELGQGVQHAATRVPDLCSMIQYANDRRKITGVGLSFLSIPPSYYGYLTAEHLVRDAGLTTDSAHGVVQSLGKAGLIDSSNAVKLESTAADIRAALPEDLRTDALTEKVLRARYSNLYSILGDTFSEEQYLKIMRNNILVDVQGEDVLMQIFSTKILQRNLGEEAPFLEFIQRLCSAAKKPGTAKRSHVKPGCGGFGIRNFLTLFISIELSKASQARIEAERLGDTRAASVATQTLHALMLQLEESNPILTEISEAMSGEGSALQRNDLEEAEAWAAKKAAANRTLQEVSARYAELTARIRTATDMVADAN